MNESLPETRTSEKKSKPLRKPYVRPEKGTHYFGLPVTIKPNPARNLNFVTDQGMMQSYSKQSQVGRQMITVEDYKKTAKNEKELQSQCENYLRENSIWFVHIPDAAYKHKKSGHALLGVPDLIIMRPDSKDNYNRCLLVELKAASGSVRSGQKRVARTVNVFEIRSYVAFLDLVNDFFKVGI